LVATILIITVMAVFISVPTMIAARIVGVGNTGFIPCLTATFLAVVASNVIESILPTQQLLSNAVQFIVSAGLVTFVLRASVIQGALVTILLLVIQVSIIAGIAALGYATIGRA
jgi:hypothetical protein